MTKKIFYIFITLITIGFGTKIHAFSGDWKLYNTFDSNIQKIIDTPDKVYMHVWAQPYLSTTSGYSEEFPMLFAYDKDSEEMIGLNKRNKLSDNIVSFVDYNPDKKYLLIVYSNSSIDFVYDSGEVYTVSSLMSANIPYSKKVNFVTFDPEKNHVYVATDFGYLVLNDKKHEVSSSRIYGKKILSAGRIGDNLIIFDEEKGYHTSATSVDPSFSSLTPIEGIVKPTRLMPLDANSFAFLTDGYPSDFIKATISSNGSVTLNNLSRDAFSTVSHNKDGYVITSGAQIYFLDNKGNLTSYVLTDDIRNLKSGSWDKKEVWVAADRKGLRSLDYKDGKFTVTRDYIMPNSPSAYISQSMLYHDKYGLLLSNKGDSRQLGGNAYIPSLINGLKHGEWTHYGPAYGNPGRASVITDPHGLAIDPNDPKYVYQSSRFNGIVRFNLEDPEDILHMSYDLDADKGKSGFYVIAPTQKFWNKVCGFTDPEFDSYGNLWCSYENNDIPRSQNYTEVYVWPSEARKAGDASGWKVINVPGSVNTWKAKLKPLKYSSNKNFVVVCPNETYDPIMLLNHKGTLDNTSDDDVVVMKNLYDQDGNSVNCQYVYSIFEDMESGLVWIGTDAGIFTFNPVNIFNRDSQRVNRIKVARNDGTNLADYLLDGVPISQITSDNKGRKWIATEGAGLVCTSGDGRTINFTLTEENSFIPSNNVYGVAYNPEDNSMMISTDHGLASYYPSGNSGSSAEESQVKVYPNPVRPDYFGWVTIEGLPDNARVKIVDSMGGLVKELGPAEGGRLQWDVTNHERRGVKSGVYFIMASSGANDENFAKVSKILVIR